MVAFHHENFNFQRASGAPKHILRNKESYLYSSPLSHSYYLFPKASCFSWFSDT